VVKSQPSSKFAVIYIRWLPLTIGMLAIIARLIPGPRTIDDAYITFRYARNILAGSGFVYNPGEHVLGTTTPLYTILLVLFGAITGGDNAPFPLIALYVNAIADGVTCVLLYLLGDKLGSRTAGTGAAFVWVIAPFSVTFAIGGLETSVYVMLLVSTIYCFLIDHRLLGTFLAALALMTRPDALILLIPLGLDRIIQATTQVLRNDTSERFKGENVLAIWKNIRLEGIVFLIPTLVWVSFAYFYYGSPLPHSIAAKSLAYRQEPTAALVRLLQHYGTPFLEQLTFGTVWVAFGLILYLFLFVIGSVRAIRSNPRIWPLCVYPWLYLTIFAVFNPLIFRWYLTPPLPAYFLFILLGADQLIYSLSNKFSRNELPPKPTILQKGISQLTEKIFPALFIIVLPIGFSLRDWTLHPDHGLPNPAPEMAWYKLELLYQQAANFLKPQIQGSNGTMKTIAAGDVGVLGFNLPARILDTVGLNTPIASTYYPLDRKYYTINYAIPPDLIMDVKPDFLVILEVYGRNGLLKDARFWDEYEALKTYPTDIYGSKGLIIFRQKQ
jgi:hypothetical protein